VDLLNGGADEMKIVIETDSQNYLIFILQVLDQYLIEYNLLVEKN
jgi:hypothetical protein